MISRQELEGKWKQISGMIRERWGELTDDDFQQVKGDAEKLVGIIQQKTGQSRREIESFLQHAASNGQQVTQQAAETARQFVDAAGKKLQETYDTASKKVSAGYETATKQLQDTYNVAGQRLEEGYGEARAMVKSRPVESVLAAFGVGIVSGIMVCLMMRSQRNA
ncbi:CsbD family protein [Planctomicrobium sp. SH668]|uniref:CsbD family protein n=1 Tax=Planctomicrobium sp. SH668 TaxID=3448126 RepID=UPI003F5BFE81